jgi:hypothetical protein
MWYMSRGTSDKRRPSLRLFTLAAVLTLTFAPDASASPASWHPAFLPKSLARALDAYNRGTIDKDTKVLGALVTDDYMLVNSDSSVQGKASYLADFEMAGFEIEPYRIEHPFARVQRDSALTGGVFLLRWTQSGKNHTRRLRVVHLWIRKRGDWRLAFTQLTRVPD